MIILTMIVLLVSIPASQSIQTSSTNFDANLYFGANGYTERTPTATVGSGIGQTAIGEINIETYPFAAQYGIFYINVTDYTLPYSILVAFQFSIYDRFMESIILNFSQVNITTLNTSSCS